MRREYKAKWALPNKTAQKNKMKPSIFDGNHTAVETTLLLSRRGARRSSTQRIPPPARPCVLVHGVAGGVAWRWWHDLLVVAAVNMHMRP